MIKISITRGVVLAAALFTVAPTIASAKTWGASHPRREQVNDRLANQNRRIRNEVKEGDLTRGQARQLHAEDRTIRQEERDYAKLDHGHISKAEKRALNQQENHVSRQIGQ
jgi:hypothetical protein|uniref:hypothetical protein n=1 Tax=Sphingomonas sp. TaxID=28214 RepID=UPI0025DC3F5A|nr:hypothetical protein [Sphingomonas sp.]